MSDAILTCPRCRLKYPAELGPCPQCRQRERTTANSPAGRRSALRQESAYQGSRALIGMVTALGLVAAVLIIILAFQPGQDKALLLAEGGATALAALLQNLALAALLDLADAALRPPGA